MVMTPAASKFENCIVRQLHRTLVDVLLMLQAVVVPLLLKAYSSLFRTRTHTSHAGDL